MMQAGMNQMKDQAKSLIPSEMQDKNEQGSSPKVGAGDVRKKAKKEVCYN